MSATSISLNKPKLDNLVGEIWKSAVRLRGKFKAYEYRAVVGEMVKRNRLAPILNQYKDERFGPEDLSNLEHQIDTLVAYRKSLIHECVNGQQRVTAADVQRATMAAR